MDWQSGHYEMMSDQKVREGRERAETTLLRKSEIKEKRSSCCSSVGSVASLEHWDTGSISCSVVCTYSSDLIPGLGTPCAVEQPKNTNKQREGDKGWGNYMRAQHFQDRFFCFFFSCLWSFQGCTYSIWRFPGQGSNQGYSCQSMPQPQQCQIRAASSTYTTAHGNTGSIAH